MVEVFGEHQIPPDSLAVKRVKKLCVLILRSLRIAAITFENGFCRLRTYVGEMKIAQRNIEQEKTLCKILKNSTKLDKGFREYHFDRIGVLDIVHIPLRQIIGKICIGFDHFTCTG